MLVGGSSRLVLAGGLSAGAAGWWWLHQQQWRQQGGGAAAEGYADGEGNALLQVLSDETDAGGEVGVDPAPGLAWRVLLCGQQVVGVLYRLCELAVYFAVPLGLLPAVGLVQCIAPSTTYATRCWECWWDALLWAVEKNGPALIKLAQWFVFARVLVVLFLSKYCSTVFEGCSVHCFRLGLTVLMGC